MAKYRTLTPYSPQIIVIRSNKSIAAQINHNKALWIRSQHFVVFLSHFWHFPCTLQALSSTIILEFNQIITGGRVQCWKSAFLGGARSKLFFLPNETAILVQLGRDARLCLAHESQVRVSLLGWWAQVNPIQIESLYSRGFTRWSPWNVCRFPSLLPRIQYGCACFCSDCSARSRSAHLNLPWLHRLFPSHHYSSAGGVAGPATMTTTTMTARRSPITISINKEYHSYQHYYDSFIPLDVRQVAPSIKCSGLFDCLLMIADQYYYRHCNLQLLGSRMCLFGLSIYSPYRSKNSSFRPPLLTLLQTLQINLQASTTHTVTWAWNSGSCTCNCEPTLLESIEQWKGKDGRRSGCKGGGTERHLLTAMWVSKSSPRGPKYM